MSQVEIQISKSQNFLLPSGKELTLLDVLSFCYGLSETDVQILMALIRSSPKVVKDLEQELHHNKAVVNRSLNKLLGMGLVKRTENTEKTHGGAKYVYYVPKFDELKDKLVEEVGKCVNSMINLIFQFVCEQYDKPNISIRFSPLT